ncbi:MazG nucleotide pyrophosphohydrolase domain-containing protein [Actinomadura kijaniata]|uniref:MazG nucleotide pyrophosphohydrolase domain-containing protein n=1 Tax=Actinomadura kijaniata TaxID=46161 RepID=UPI00082E0348|nr:MazG nucleotide pyrophosphohydrolase domain-containing protein [Actinomadura kijaniata]
MPPEPIPTAPSDLGAVIAERLRAHFPADNERDRQVMALAEEVGEFVGAYRRWSGNARRTGSFDDVRDELADVVITAYVTAAVLDVDLDEAVGAKAARLFTRGWRDGPAD